jgi:hypothetical protein
MKPHKRSKRALNAVIHGLRHIATCLEDYSTRHDRGEMKELTFEICIGAVLISVWTRLLPLVEAAETELDNSDPKGGGR